jgi:hypothetical protein
MAKHSKSEKDIRVTTTQKIWSYATGMLALSLIFAPMKNNVILPLAVVAGAAGSTVFVWQSDKKSKKSLQPHQLQQLEERVANLEAIAGTNDLDLQLKIKSLESHQDQISKS